MRTQQQGQFVPLDMTNRFTSQLDSTGQEQKRSTDRYDAQAVQPSAHGQHSMVLPPPREAPEKDIVRWRVGLSIDEMLATARAFFGTQARPHPETRALIDSGQMAPKEVVTMVDQANQDLGQYIFREFPFYVQGGAAFVRYVTDFQDWLARYTGLTPQLERTVGNALYTDKQGTGGSVFTFVQRFVDAKNLISIYTGDGAHIAGKFLFAFHQSSKRYLSSPAGSQIPAGMHKNASGVLDDLFTWIEKEYQEKFPHPEHRLQFSQLAQHCRAVRKDFAIDESQHPLCPRVLVHGDYNPGNVIVDAEGFARAVDFDDLRVDHPAHDVAHALVQMLVFRFFDKSIVNRRIPAQLGAADRALGKTFLTAYLHRIEDAGQKTEILDRLRQEIPLAIYRGTLLGFLGPKFPRDCFAGCAETLASLIGDFDAWLQQERDSLLMQAPAPPPRPARELWHRGLSKARVIARGGFAGGQAIYEDYHLEMLDPQHQYAVEHRDVLRPQWEDSGEPEYFAWLKEHRSRTNAPATKVAYHGKAEAQRYHASIVDGHLVTGPHFPDAWRVRMQQQEARLLFAVDGAGQMHVGFKGESPWGKLHHNSFTAGSAVRAAGFLSVNTEGKILRIASESGHYRPTRAVFGKFIEDLHRTGKINHDVVVHFYGDAPCSLRSFLGDDAT